ncbi:MAG: PPOX class F420-dependent oxidoreductase [Actinomycetota bacterium]
MADLDPRIASLAAESYVAFTTYKRSGEGRTSPVWIADLGDGTLGFTTADDSWKAKRLRNDPRCVLQPSNSRGTVKDGSSPTEATAVMVSGAEFEAVKAAIVRAYGWQFRLIGLMGTVAGLFGRSNTSSNAGVVITLADATAE